MDTGNMYQATQSAHTDRAHTGTPTSFYNTNFCLRVANDVFLKEANKGFNCVLSPLSLHVMLSLVAKGAKGNTLNQLLSLLGAKSVQDLDLSSPQMVALAEEGKKSGGGPLLSFVHGARIDQRFTFKPSFQAILKGVYKAAAEEVDFFHKADQVIDQLNLWAETATKGLIKQILPPKSLDWQTIFVLGNALYFKGTWDRPFEASKTREKDFHLLNGQVVRVPFMTRFEKHLYGSYDGYKVLKIPYQSGQDSRKFAMYFLLPDKKEGLPSLIQKVNSNPSLLNQQFLLKEEDLSNFWIPKFKFSFGFEASETMKKLGLTLPFMMHKELTEMVDCPEIFISNIFHKSYIEVNEEGTEAAAVTFCFLVGCAPMRAPRPSFVADHPFMFMIREETSGLVFFTGVVLNPQDS